MDTSVWCFHGRDSFTEVQLRTADIEAHVFPWHGCLPWVYSDTLSGFIEGRGWVSLFAAGLEGERIEVFAVWRQTAHPRCLSGCYNPCCLGRT